MPTLREIREGEYLSRSALARLASVSEATIVRMEDAEHRTRKDVAERVLKALSKQTGRTITINDVEELKLYNVMRDRRNRKKEAGNE